MNNTIFGPAVNLSKNFVATLSEPALIFEEIEVTDPLTDEIIEKFFKINRRKTNKFYLA